MADIVPGTPKPYIDYRTFTLEDVGQMLVEKFAERYNRLPDEVIQYKGLIWVGPVPSSHLPTPENEPNAELFTMGVDK
jgi:hypothetical protein